MSSRLKPLAAVLILLILLLGAGLVRAKVQLTKDTGESLDDGPAADISYSVYLDEGTGLYGVMDSAGRMMIAPVWTKLTAIAGSGQGHYIAGRSVGRRLLYGMINLDEKLVIPVVYQSISPVGSRVLAAQTAEDNTFLFYNTDGVLLFQEAFESYNQSGTTLNLFCQDLNCSAELEGGGLRLTALRATTPMLSKRLSMSFTEDEIAAVQHYTVLPKITAVSAQYLGAMILDNYNAAYAITAVGAYQDVIHSGLFRDCTQVTVEQSASRAFETTESYRYTASFTLGYTRVLETMNGTARTAQCRRAVTLSMTFDADGALLIDRVVIGDEEILSEDPPLSATTTTVTAAAGA